MKHVALVLARSGSRSIPNKNIYPINGVPLIGYCLKVLNACEFFDEIWISTDDQEIGQISQSLASRVQIHTRQKLLASDKCSSLDSVKDFLDTRPDADVIYLVQCTSPCLNKFYLKQAYSLMITGELESVFSVTRSHALRWSCTTNGDLCPINFDPNTRPRRQDWQGELVESGHFYIATRRLILEEGLLQSRTKSAVIEVPSYMSSELDEPWQIPFVELMIKLYYDEEVNSLTTNSEN